jgi:hypothetical protein
MLPPDQNRKGGLYRLRNPDLLRYRTFVSGIFFATQVSLWETPGRYNRERFLNKKVNSGVNRMFHIFMGEGIELLPPRALQVIVNTARLNVNMPRFDEQEFGAMVEAERFREFPEGRMHPRMLLKRFCPWVAQRVADGREGYVLTHSAAILKLFSQMICLRELTASDVVVHVLTDIVGGLGPLSVRTVRFDAKGVLLNWDESLLEPDLEEYRALVAQVAGKV